ncbi:type VI secretion system-associated FHA domain protein TagH [Piscinibacter terrae]|nr:type VI secretion system-associated FHA domain protein TagH [Albitalea terrae]
MTLTLRAVSLNDLPLTQPITAHFDAHGGTIGRADHNTMALPDPVRHISRQQAQITAGRSGYVIKNIGSANPILVRNQALAQGESATLMHSDQVRIGGYLLEVIDESAGDDNATTITRGRGADEPMGHAPLPMPPAMAGDMGGPLSSSNPFADLLRDPSAPAPSHARLPDDFDPFATTPVVGPPSAPRPEAQQGAFGDLIPSAAPASIDEIFGLKPSAGRDPLADFMAGVGTPPAADKVPVSTDPLAMFAPVAEQAALPPEVMPDHTPELHAAFVPPKPLEEVAEVAREPVVAPPVEAEAVPPESAAPAEPWSGDAAALWKAFCEGAGIRLNPPQGANPELMRIVGKLLRSAVEGTLQMMAVRQATRHELHAQVTIIRPRNNNPLKFSPDAQSALEQLLQPPMRGFLPGPAAMSDAMNDLVGHAIGTMAGTRAALEGVLGRFTPHDLEAKLAGKSVIDSVLPMNRKAKLWELYLQHYDGIRDEAQEDFQTLFGKAFLAAYEQQLERLKREKETSSAK